MRKASGLSSMFAIIVASAALTGCIPDPTAGEGRPDVAEPSATPVADPGPESPGLPEQLTFDAGADLDPEYWRAGWHVEPLDMTHGYPIVFERDDWEEVQFGADGCVAKRSHSFGPLEGLDRSLDDLALTNQYLAGRLESPVEEIAQNGSTVDFAVAGRWPMSAEFRVGAGGWSDGRTWLEAVRVFGALDTALVVGIECDPGAMTDASGQALFDRLYEVMGEDSLAVGVGRVDWNVVEVLDFRDGADLIESSEATWVDGPLMEDPSWSFDDGVADDGTWYFRSADGDCTAEFTQMLLDASYGELSSDRDATDALLQDVLVYPDASVRDDAVDGTFSLGVPGNELVAMRLIEGTYSGKRWITSARALMEPLFGFTLAVTCERGDPGAALGEVIVKSALQVVP